MRIAVFGASGRTGRPLVEQALDRGHEVVAFVRDPASLSSSVRDDDRVAVVAGDAYTGDGVDRAVGGDEASVDAVVSVLGQTDGSPDDLLTAAGEHVLAAMDQHGVDRFVTLVGAGVREEGESVSLGGRVMESLLKLLARAALEDARDHVETVRTSDARWTVVRAPRLTEDEHTGAFRHGTDLTLGMRDAAARANVAAFVLDCLEAETYVGEMPKVADER
ncbi:NAD-dependent epimerase/dehydratase family protein [Halorubrum sp. SS7]|uniref:NAD(P)H-binding protein n=1 Tax=Halorubrum salinarum TaxID=2739057 RepID=A0A7D4D3X1_9EURY|nr:MULTISPECIES: NAD(P)H-binding protein [Halorubrum]QKG93262.1 NAD(P)H-binding protein [Halorubrum salinarum]TKX56968.1 NAD-dependent epimerase/dehydratase family protein [Halorubrum sp. SS7]